MRPALKFVLLGGAIAAVLDIVYAFGFYGLRGVPPLRILQSIASGLLGEASYRGGPATAALGAFLHLAIAVAAAATFFLASLRFKWLVEHALPAGIGFGLCVYAVMNFIVVPLSAFPHPQRFPPAVLVGGLLAHMFLVGVPVALCVRAGSRAARP